MKAPHISSCSHFSSTKMKIPANTVLELHGFVSALGNFTEMERIKSLHIVCFCQVTSPEISKPLLEAAVKLVGSIALPIKGNGQNSL